MNKKLIFLAEDEAAYRKILQDSLEKEGYDVEIALNGDALLNHPRIKQASLIILDLIMPVKNGFQVLVELKENEQLKHIPVIALSNLGQEDDREKAKKLGADDYIIKSDQTLFHVITKIKGVLN